MTILEYFNLNEEPFCISPNPRFLFLNEQVKEASSKVSYMTKHRTAPLYMYGAIGSGKTSILRRLYEELKDDDTYTLRLLIAPNVKSSMAFLRSNHVFDHALAKRARRGHRGPPVMRGGGCDDHILSDGTLHLSPFPPAPKEQVRSISTQIDALSLIKQIEIGAI